MPYIGVRTALTLSELQKEKLARGLGELITVIPGKTEEVLMIEIDDALSMYFRGKKNDSCVFMDVRCYKQTPFESNKIFTEKLFQFLISELGVAEKDVYVSISELPVWGTKGTLK